MRSGKTVSLFVFSFLLVALVILALPQTTHSQQLGCCLNPTGTASCSGCEGLACAISASACASEFPESMFTPMSYCSEGGCSNDTIAGCCVIEAGNCTQVVSLNACEAPENGIAFFAGVGCNQVPACSEPGAEPPSVTNVPTLSQWSLIALAGILGLIGFIVVLRRKETA